MATLDDVRRFALAFPDARERDLAGLTGWWVADRAFLRERPHKPEEIEAFGDDVPPGVILAAHLPADNTQAKLLAAAPEAYFSTMPAGYPLIQVCLERISLAELEKVTRIAYLCRAPRRLVKQYRDEQKALKS
jgi:hypothetical protein